MMHPFLFLLLQTISTIDATTTTTTTINNDRSLSENNPLDHYCGTTWPQAAETCSQPCPTGQDDECSNIGETCFGYTGCNAKVLEDTTNSAMEGGKGENMVAANKYCGVTW